MKIESGLFCLDVPDPRRFHSKVPGDWKAFQSHSSWEPALPTAGFSFCFAKLDKLYWSDRK